MYPGSTITMNSSNIHNERINNNHSNNSSTNHCISRLSGVIFWRLKRNSSNNENNSKKQKKDKSVQNHKPCCSSDDENQPATKKLNYSLDELIRRVDNKSDETALSPDDECLICVTRRACVQSYPCGHKLLCEKCFVKLLQMNYSQGKYPLTCIFCRSPVALFKRHESPSAVIIKKSTSPPGSEARSDFSSLSTNNVHNHLPRTSILRPGYL